MTEPENSASAKNILALRGDVHVKQVLGGEKERPLPLVDPFQERPDEDQTLLGSLRVSERRFTLVGRDHLIEQALDWLQPSGTEPDHRALIIHGPGGSGKTRLAAEILQKAKSEGWKAGFLSGNLSTFDDWHHLGYPERKMIIALDYAEARFDDLRLLLSDPPVDHVGSAPLRLVLIVREGGPESQSWLERLTGGRQLPGRANQLLGPGKPLVFPLDDSLPRIEDRNELWSAAQKVHSDDRRQPPAYLSTPLFTRPLFILLDAYRVSFDGNAEVPPTAAELIQAVLRHEREYWNRSLKKIDLQLDERSMNQVAVVATLLGGVSRSGFEEALTSLDWLRDNPTLLLRVADWWCLVYATGKGPIRGVEPDIVGEYLITRAMSESTDARSQLEGSMRADQVSSLIGSATLVGRQRVLRVLTRIANSESDIGHEAAKTVLSEILSQHLTEFLPATFAPFDDVSEYGTTGEPLAMTVASAVLACDQLELVASTPTVDKGEPALDSPASTIFNAALKIVRRQLDHVGRRELDADRWSAERFADLSLWAVRIDLKSHAFPSAQERVEFLETLEPRPRRGLALHLTEMGRHMVEYGEYETAEDLFESAAAELQAGGESDTPLAYAVLHELGGVAFSTNRRELAIERLQKAWEGKRAHQGLRHRDTFPTFVSLVWALAPSDLDRALALVEEVRDQLEGEGAEESEVLEASKRRASAFISVGRVAEAEEEFDEAVAQYNRALEELNKLGEENSPLAYIALHDLGDVAAAKGDRDRAKTLYDQAFEGRRQLLGLEDPGTIMSLVFSAQQAPATDVDAQVARLDEFVEELISTHPDQAQVLVESQVELLARQRRFSDAQAIQSRFHARMLKMELRRAILEAVADPTLEEVPAFPLAVDAALLAALVFSPKDSKFAPLASRLAALLLLQATGLFQTQVSEDVLLDLVEEPLQAALESLYPNNAELVKTMNEHADEAASLVSRMMREAPALPRLLSTVAAGVDAEIRGIIEEDPLIESLRTGEPAAAIEIARDSMVRNWLVQAVIKGVRWEKLAITESAMGRLLSLYVGLEEGLVSDPPFEVVVPKIWSQELSADLVERQRSRLVQEAQEVGGLEREEALRLVGAGHASALLEAGRAAETARDYPMARRLYERALGEMSALGRSDTPLAYRITNDLADAFAALDETETAIEHYEKVLAGKRRMYGLGDADTLATLEGLVVCQAREDIDGALARLDQTLEELREEGGGESDLAAIGRYRANALLASGRAARDKGDQVGAKEAYLRGLDALNEAGQEDSQLAHVIAHDLGAALEAAGERAEALRRYAGAFEGKRRLRGLTDTSTLYTLRLWLACLAKDSYSEAMTRLDEVMAELEDPVQEAAAVELGRVKADIFLEGARAARPQDSTSALRLFRRSLNELVKIGEGDNGAAQVVRYELGETYDDRGETAMALPQLAAAYRGLIRTNGPADPSTLVVLRAFARLLAPDDPDAAITYLDRAIEELGSAGDPAELYSLRRAKGLVLLEGGRKALSRRRPATALSRFRRAEKHLPELEEEDAVLPYVLQHDIGDALIAEGEAARAVEHYEAAWEGKKKLLGGGDPDALNTLRSLVGAMAEVNLDAALSRLDHGLEELKELGLPPDRLDQDDAFRISLIVESALRARGEGDLEEAKALLLRPPTPFRGQARPLQISISHELGEIAAAEGLREAAAGHYDEALALLLDCEPLAVAERLDVAEKIISSYARQDLPAALERLPDVVERLEGEEGVAPERLARLRPTARLEAGRAEENEKNFAAARELYEAAHAELVELGEKDSSLAHFLLREAGDALSGEGRHRLALERYEEALSGLRESLGLAHQMSVLTLLSTLDAVEREKPSEALARAGAAAEELRAVPGAEQHLASVEAWIADRVT